MLHRITCHGRIMPRLAELLFGRAASNLRQYGNFKCIICLWLGESPQISARDVIFSSYLAKITYRVIKAKWCFSDPFVLTHICVHMHITSSFIMCSMLIVFITIWDRLILLCQVGQWAVSRNKAVFKNMASAFNLSKSGRLPNHYKSL